MVIAPESPPRARLPALKRRSAGRGWDYAFPFLALQIPRILPLPLAIRAPGPRGLFPLPVPPGIVLPKLAGISLLATERLLHFLCSLLDQTSVFMRTRLPLPAALNEVRLPPSAGIIILVILLCARLE